jgi:hypothetical protein
VRICWAIKNNMPRVTSTSPTLWIDRERKAVAVTSPAKSPYNGEITNAPTMAALVVTVIAE